MLKFWKLHLTNHQKKNIEDGVPGHDYNVDDIQHIADNPENEYIQEDGRKVLHGRVNNKVVKAVLSCPPFSTATAGIVTAHRSRMPKKDSED